MRPNIACHFARQSGNILKLCGKYYMHDWSIIDEVTTRNTTAFFDPLCSGHVNARSRLVLYSNTIIATLKLRFTDRLLRMVQRGEDCMGTRAQLLNQLLLCSVKCNNAISTSRYHRCATQLNNSYKMWPLILNC